MLHQLESIGMPEPSKGFPDYGLRAQALVVSLGKGTPILPKNAIPYYGYPQKVPLVWETPIQGNSDSRLIRLA